MRFFLAIMMIGLLTLSIPAVAQPRDEAPAAMPVEGGATSAAEELTTGVTKPVEAEAEKPAEKKPVDKKPAKKPAPAKKEKKKEEKKPEKKKEEKKPEPVKEPVAEKEPEAKKPAPAAPAVSSGKDPVIVINPCTGDVSEELVAPQRKSRTIQPGKEKTCLTERQCDALCRTGEAFGEGGGAPRLSPRGDIVFGADAYTDFDACVTGCGPKCK